MKFDTLLKRVESLEAAEGPDSIFLLDCLQPFPAARESMIAVLEEVGA